MSAREITPNSSEPSNPPESNPRTMRSRLRRFFLRHLPLAVACIVVFLGLLSVGLYFVASSAAFENVVRKRLIASIEELTGGRVEIATFHWRLLHFEAEADGLVIHGLEDPGEAPYAQIERLRVHVSVRNLFSPYIRLRSLEIERPSVHLIVYPDGSTNQPHPRNPRRSRKSAIDTLFDMRAGHIAVEQGMLHYDNRAAAFDFQNRYAPLDFEANDVSVLLRYLPAAKGTPETYRIEAGAADLNLSRAAPRGKSTPVHGTLQATIDLERAGFCFAVCGSRPTVLIPGTIRSKSPKMWRISPTRAGRSGPWAIWTCGSSIRSPAILTRPRASPTSISLPEARQRHFTSTVPFMWTEAPTLARALLRRASPSTRVFMPIPDNY